MCRRFICVRRRTTAGAQAGDRGLWRPCRHGRDARRGTGSALQGNRSGHPALSLLAGASAKTALAGPEADRAQEALSHYNRAMATIEIRKLGRLWCGTGRAATTPRGVEPALRRSLTSFAVEMSPAALLRRVRNGTAAGGNENRTLGPPSEGARRFDQRRRFEGRPGARRGATPARTPQLSFPGSRG